MDTTRRGNYDSGQDFVLEYGELRFTFNERDFGERCEQAALKVGFVDGRLSEPELEDLVNLVVNGEVHDPASALGEHVNDCWPDRGDVPTFELLTLEAFQSGLSWLTILRKRDAFRRAFDGFEIDRVADYGSRDLERLLGDASIVRNRAKIEATIRNAQATRRL